jgi:hypothetical protein
VARLRGLLQHDGDQRPTPATTGQALAADASCRP